MDWMVSLVAWVRRFMAFVGGPALLLSGVLVLLGLVFLAHEWRLDHVGLRTSGVVETNREQFGPKGGVYGYPLFRFRLPNGRVVVVQSKQGSDPPEFHADETVRVRYAAGNPEGAVLAPVMDVYGVSIALGGAGILVLDFGIFALLRQKRRIRKGLDGGD